MTLKTFTRLTTLYLISLALQDKKNSEPNFTKVEQKKYDSDIAKIEKELRLITGNEALTLVTLLAYMNKELSKQRQYVLSQILMKKKRYIKRINKILNQPNSSFKMKLLNNIISELEKGGLDKIPVKTKRGIEHWSTATYYKKQERKIRYSGYREASIIANKEINNDFYLVVHRVNEKPRLLCAPYENAIISYELSTGTHQGIYTINISDTSHGQGGGLFEDWCRHVPIPYIPDLDLGDVNLDVFL